jgi:hypothetical protein
VFHFARVHPALTAIFAVVLAAYGIYTALFIPPLLIGETSLLILTCFVLQAVAALAAAFGMWRGRPWAGIALVLLGVSIAVTELIEAFVLGILPWLRAVFVAVLAIVLSLLLARLVRPARAA